ncbi:hypothetical protein [Paenibacillus sp. ISL-20]|uniref:hypothetical protein n=1 Tax=Paenibacillus sp. ISL-20 TaxID=2819163 RepID=UPI001BEC97FD|nr:hypothetical protein [Paenibacillus sp. ISL-20]MBT2762189.1 hypothetical protein [Paenibacillus sp. ISL-20]
MFIDKTQKQNITIRPLEEGFMVYGLSKSFWGWKVTDTLLIPPPGTDSFKVTEKTFHYSPKKDVHVIFIPTQLSRIDHIEACRDNGEGIAFNSTVNEETKLYYYYSEQPKGKVEYKTFSKAGELIDKK